METILLTESHLTTLGSFCFLNLNYWDGLIEDYFDDGSINNYLSFPDIPTDRFPGAMPDHSTARKLETTRRKYRQQLIEN